MKLRDAIETASEMSYNEDAEMIIGQIDGSWQVAHGEDMGRQANMEEPMFRVTSSGVAQEHIDRNEITENWEIPVPAHRITDYQQKIIADITTESPFSIYMEKGMGKA